MIVNGQRIGDSAYHVAELPRILHVTTAHGAFDTRIYYKEIRSLVDAGYRVGLATTVDAREVHDGVTLIPLGSGAGRHERWRRLIRGMRAFFLMLRSPKTIIHIHDPELLIAAYIPAIMGRTLVYDVHEFYATRIADSTWMPRFVRRPLSRMYQSIERLVLRSFAGVVVVADEMLDDYRRVVRDDQIALVRNYPNVSPTEMTQARMRPPSGQPYILHTGGASLLRAFHTLVSAAEHLREHGCQWPIYNLGPVDLSGYDSDTQKQLIERAQRTNIRNLGLLPQAETWAFVAHAAIGFMPLIAVENNLRGLPNKLFEYLLFGVPVVATDMGQVAEILRQAEAGILFPPEDSQAAGEALWRLASDSDLRADVANSALVAGSRFSFRTEGEKLIYLYERIAQDM